MSGLLISLWEPDNWLFVRDKYVTLTGKRLHAGYVQKAEARKNIPFDTTALTKEAEMAVNMTLVCVMTVTKI